MDKKNFTIGAVLLLAAFAFLIFGPRSSPAPAARPAATDKAPATTAPGTSTTAASPGQSQPAAPAAGFAAVNRDSADATVTKIGNSFIEARFTDSGGALREVALIKRDDKGRLIYPDNLQSDTPFIFNALHTDPILAFVDFPGLDRNARFERVSASPTEVVYRAVLENPRIEVTRRYTVSPDASDKTDPYQIHYETTLRNLGDAPMQPMRISLALGTAAPTNANDPGLQLATGYSTGSDRQFIARTKLEPGSGMFGIGAHGATPAITSPGPIAWAAVKNQFFASILAPTQPGSGMVTRRVKLLSILPDEDARAYGITGAAQFEVPSLAPKAETKLGGHLYVGPKEYRRLANANVFKADEDKVMDFGFFKFFSQILLTLMTWIHGFTNNWGLAIILTTLTLKTIFIPLTLSASRSAKRMAKIQPELQAIREKHKDNPQKQQMATMELFKSRKINPVGGCFPVLITIPFFMGFFTMLGSAAELRFQPFLWAPDLSSTDTVAVLFGIIPLRIMPLLMGATMVVQMHLTPSPSVDNAQVKMMKFMPYVFTFFCYNFSCALSLYSFVNGLFTIGQQLVINRMKDAPDGGGPAGPGTAAAETAMLWKKGTKNITPKKK